MSLHHACLPGMSHPSISKECAVWWHQTYHLIPLLYWSYKDNYFHNWYAINTLNNFNLIIKVIYGRGGIHMFSGLTLNLQVLVSRSCRSLLSYLEKLPIYASLHSAEILIPSQLGQPAQVTLILYVHFWTITRYFIIRWCLHSDSRRIDVIIGKSWPDHLIGFANHHYLHIRLSVSVTAAYILGGYRWQINQVIYQHSRLMITMWAKHNFRWFMRFEGQVTEKRLSCKGDSLNSSRTRIASQQMDNRLRTNRVEIALPRICQNCCGWDYWLWSRTEWIN